MGVRIQEKIKRLAGKCHLCDETDYHVLDVHRWKFPGAVGGSYDKFNGVALCACCHRRVEFGEIEILGRYFTSKGKYVLHVKRDGKEDWIYEPVITDMEQDLPNN